MRRLILLLLLLAGATPAWAQQSESIPPFVLDVRGAFTFLGDDATTAMSLGIATDDLATRAYGVTGGIHVYPLRRRTWALGLGGEMLVAGTTKQRFDPLDDKIAIGPQVQRQLRSLSGQLSLNFGHRQGWSYLTAGIGPTRFDTFLPPSVPDGLNTMSENFGFGARWFSTEHVAFTVDMRFYLTKPAEPTAIVGARQRLKVTVLSAGISLK